MFVVWGTPLWSFDWLAVGYFSKWYLRGSLISRWMIKPETKIVRFWSVVVVGYLQNLKSPTACKLIQTELLHASSADGTHQLGWCKSKTSKATAIFIWRREFVLHYAATSVNALKKKNFFFGSYALRKELERDQNRDKLKEHKIKTQRLNWTLD